MRKVFIILFAILFLAGCTKNTPMPKEEKPPEGYLPTMVNIYKKAPQDIQNAVDTENKKLENALDESGVNN